MSDYKSIYLGKYCIRCDDPITRDWYEDSGDDDNDTCPQCNMVLMPAVRYDISDLKPRFGGCQHTETISAMGSKFGFCTKCSKEIPIT